MPFLLQVMLARPSAFSALLPVSFFGLQIDEDQMRVGAARNERKAVLHHDLAQGAGIVHDVLDVDLDSRAAALRRTPRPWRR